jgi:MoaA/NifB/PqqE/SkfB family radical SAM enzyme
MLHNVLRSDQNAVTLYKTGCCWISNRVFRRPAISSIEIINTLNCNAHCRFCSNFKLSPAEKTMKRETALATIREAARAKIPMAIFLGGEGLLDENIFEYFDLCRRSNIIAQYCSNGTTLTEEMIGRLETHGVRRVCITLHDGIAEKHDEIVGVPGALDMIVTAFREMKRRGFLVSGKTIYSNESASSGAFRRALDLCRAEGVNVSANPSLPVGRSAREQARLGADGIAEYYPICREEGIGDHVYNGWNPGCPAGKTYFGILPGGEILPCYFLPLSVGNINTTTFAQARNICSRIPIFAKKFMVCPVVESKALFDEIIFPLYENDSLKLPIDITEDAALFDKLAKFTL